MSRGNKLINKLERRQRSVREATEAVPRIDKQDNVLQATPGAQRLMRGAARRRNESFGYAACGQEPVLEYAAIAASLERFDYDPDSGSDFGIRMTLATTAGLPEVTQITCVADVADSLDSTYFLYNTPENQYYVWYSTGAGVDPAVAGRTGVPVVIATGATAAQVATATRNAIHALTDVNATVLVAAVTATNTVAGPVTDAANGAASPGFSYLITQQGTSASGSLMGASGLQPGDTVQILEGTLEGRMLEVVSLSGSTARLDDVATFTTASSVAVRMLISAEKKSYR